jgi:hypothetical protein
MHPQAASSIRRPSHTGSGLDTMPPCNKHHPRSSRTDTDRLLRPRTYLRYQSSPDTYLLLYYTPDFRCTAIRHSTAAHCHHKPRNPYLTSCTGRDTWRCCHCTNRSGNVVRSSSVRHTSYHHSWFHHFGSSRCTRGRRSNSRSFPPCKDCFHKRLHCCRLRKHRYCRPSRFHTPCRYRSRYPRNRLCHHNRRPFRSRSPLAEVCT